MDADARGCKAWGLIMLRGCNFRRGVELFEAAAYLVGSYQREKELNKDRTTNLRLRLHRVPREQSRRARTAPFLVGKQSLPSASVLSSRWTRSPRWRVLVDRPTSRVAFEPSRSACESKAVLATALFVGRLARPATPLIAGAVLGALRKRDVPLCGQAPALSVAAPL